MSDGGSVRIPENWYEKTELKFVCLRCHKVFKRAYKSRNLVRRKRPRGANMFSLWAWYNFRKHLLKCWGWSGAATEPWPTDPEERKGGVR